MWRLACLRSGWWVPTYLPACCLLPAACCPLHSTKAQRGVGCVQGTGHSTELYYNGLAAMSAGGREDGGGWW